MSQSGSLSLQSGTVPPNVAQAYVTDVGTAVPAGNVLNVLGDGFIATSGAGNTITISPGTPNKVIYDFDDFISGSNGTSKFPYLNGAGWTTKNGTATHPGIVKNISNALPNSLTIAPSGGSQDQNSFVLGAGSLSINWVFDPIALSTNAVPYTAYIGLADTLNANSVQPPVDGVYFQYTHTVNSGNWQIVAIAGGVSTVHNTSTAASIGFHNYGVSINAAGTSASFTIDGVVVANSPVASNLPTNPISPTIIIYSTNPIGPVPLVEIDLFYYTQILNAAR